MKICFFYTFFLSHKKKKNCYNSSHFFEKRSENSVKLIIWKYIDFVRYPKKSYFDLWRSDFPILQIYRDQDKKRWIIKLKENQNSNFYRFQSFMKNNCENCRSKEICHCLNYVTRSILIEVDLNYRKNNFFWYYFFRVCKVEFFRIACIKTLTMSFITCIASRNKTISDQSDWVDKNQSVTSLGMELISFRPLNTFLIWIPPCLYLL